MALSDYEIGHTWGISITIGEEGLSLDEAVMKKKKHSGSIDRRSRANEGIGNRQKRKARVATFWTLYLGFPFVQSTKKVKTKT